MLEGLEPGINVENMKAVVAKLKEAIGENWVSDDPAVLTAYSRDFTITPGRWPNVVVLPGSTEDVQKIIKIANEHMIPVVPMSSGFNHGGMAIPRHGGIQVDLLKRMDKILDVDGESLTIRVQPGVRTSLATVATGRTVAVEGRLPRTTTVCVDGSRITWMPSLRSMLTSRPSRWMTASISPRNSGPTAPDTSTPRVRRPRMTTCSTLSRSTPCRDSTSNSAEVTPG